MNLFRHKSIEMFIRGNREMSQLKKEKAHGCGGVLLYCVVFKLYKCSYNIQYRGLGGVVVIDAAIGAHGKSRPRFKPGTLLYRCSDLGQVVNLSLSVA